MQGAFLVKQRKIKNIQSVYLTAIITIYFLRII